MTNWYGDWESQTFREEYLSIEMILTYITCILLGILLFC